MEVFMKYINTKYYVDEELKAIRDSAVNEQLKGLYPDAESKKGEGLIWSIHRRRPETILNEMIDKEAQVMKQLQYRNLKKRKRGRRGKGKREKL
jgi:hypothetical protein